MDIKKIYTGDYSQEGYTDGIKHIEANKPKQHFGSLKMHPVNWVWHFKNSRQTYVENYNKAYTDGLRKKNDVFYKSKGSSSLVSTQYEDQLNLLSEFDSSLESLKTNLRNVSKDYEEQIRNGESLGMYDDYIQGLKRRYSALNEKLSEMIKLIQKHQEHIESQHVADLCMRQQQADL